MTHTRDYLTVQKAARYLGVSPSTLRNWDREGKLSATRHPINGYRLYTRAQLDGLLAGLYTDIKKSDPRRLTS